MVIGFLTCPNVHDYSGTSGISRHCWMVGAKCCVDLNHLDQIIGWVWANTHETGFNFCELSSAHAASNNRPLRGVSTGYLTAMFSLITAWFGLTANDDGFVSILMAEFNL